MYGLLRASSRFTKRLLLRLAGVVGAAGVASACTTTLGNRTAAPGATLRAHEIAITRKAVIAALQPQVFDFITAEDVLPKVLTGYGPLPRVVGTSANTGPWDTPGSARLVHLADGSAVREQVTGFTRATGFTYRVWDFGNPVLRRLAESGRGDWTFVPVPGGTEVSWTYTFTARSGFSAVLLAAVVQVLWRGYMDVCLKNTKQAFAGASSGT